MYNAMKVEGPEDRSRCYIPVHGMKLGLDGKLKYFAYVKLSLIITIAHGDRTLLTQAIGSQLRPLGLLGNWNSLFSEWSELGRVPCCGESWLVLAVVPAQIQPTWLLRPVHRRS